ncbi:hypothetical protein QEV83_03070 [Methylocapsa sp. D3K7]|uniref:hypothetical protein n=1 Tax=Methylocapsa sp. D3K7 TaxID=3041435 RepID=UPI00244EC453|nr:hypothetical protein [Methylocapsa sp. D3K7]WGJ15292.1 hypothetical protein QEV83_03070 [Methylocapsa sp. D3K7]
MIQKPAEAQLICFPNLGRLKVIPDLEGKMDDSTKANWKQMIASEFEPLDQTPSPGGFTQAQNIADRRTARASEYAAAQLGELNRKMDRLIEAFEKLAAKL